MAGPADSAAPATDDSASTKYVGVRWSRKTWMWEALVQDLAGPDQLHCGLFETEAEAARAHDSAQLALDQEFPGRRQEPWKRNLPLATIFEDEVEKYRRVIEQAREGKAP